MGGRTNQPLKDPRKTWEWGAFVCVCDKEALQGSGENIVFSIYCAVIVAYFSGGGKNKLHFLPYTCLNSN